MEWLIVAAAFMLFFVVPPCLIYDCIMHPEQFGLPGPDGHYNPEAERAKAAINRFYANLPRYLSAPFRGFWWLITAEWMATKDRWWERLES